MYGCIGGLERIPPHTQCEYEIPRIIVVYFDQVTDKCNCTYRIELDVMDDNIIWPTDIRYPFCNYLIFKAGGLFLPTCPRWQGMFINLQLSLRHINVYHRLSRPGASLKFPHVTNDKRHSVVVFSTVFRLYDADGRHQHKNKNLMFCTRLVVFYVA